MARTPKRSLNLFLLHIHREPHLPSFSSFWYVKNNRGEELAAYLMLLTDHYCSVQYLPGTMPGTRNYSVFNTVAHHTTQRERYYAVSVAQMEEMVPRELSALIQEQLARQPQRSAKSHGPDYVLVLTDQQHLAPLTTPPL